MIVVKVELWPGGDESRKRELGVAYIANDCTGTPDTGSYTFQLMKSRVYAKTPGVWKQGHVAGFPRRRLGPWDLLYRVLRSSVDYRNH